MRSNAKQCKAMQRKAKQRKATQCNAMQSNAKQCNAMQSNAKQCNAMQRNAKQCKAMQSNAKQCKAMQSNAKAKLCKAVQKQNYAKAKLCKAMQSNTKQCRAIQRNAKLRKATQSKASPVIFPGNLLLQECSVVCVRVKCQSVLTKWHYCWVLPYAGGCSTTCSNPEPRTHTSPFVHKLHGTYVRGTAATHFAACAIGAVHGHVLDHALSTWDTLILK